MARLGGMFGPDVTFLGVDRCDIDDPESLRDVDIVVIGAPYDAGASYRAGARFGPRAAITMVRSFPPVPTLGSIGAGGKTALDSSFPARQAAARNRRSGGSCFIVRSAGLAADWANWPVADGWRAASRKGFGHARCPLRSAPPVRLPLPTAAD